MRRALGALVWVLSGGLACGAGAGLVDGNRAEVHDAAAPGDTTVDAAGEVSEDATGEQMHPAEVGGSDGASETGGDAGGAGCSFGAGYAFHDDGGLRIFVDRSALTPARTHSLSRMDFRADGPLECARAVPCSGASVVTVAAVQAAIANADVQVALAKTPGMLYGSDPRPVDGTVWVFERADGRSFMVGGGTPPVGLLALETLLRKLTDETLAAPECAALRR